MMRKGISPVIAILLLILIAIAASVAVYVYISTFVSRETVTTGKGIISLSLDAYKVNGKLLTLYVRNLGTRDSIVNSIYLISADGKVYEVSYAKITSGTEIWGGDVWVVDRENLNIVLSQSGKILHDTFVSRDSTMWDDSYVNYNNDWSAVYYDPDGLKLLSKSAGGWAVRGLISNQKIVNLGELPAVIEVDLQKTSYNVPNEDAAGSPFAACLYLSSEKKKNPYFATPWFAAKLYPRAYPSRTEAQLVTRSQAGVETQILYTWYSAPYTQPRGIFLLVFNQTNRVYYYFWKNSRSGQPYTSGSWSSTGLSQVFDSERLYVYLTIDNTVTVLSRKVHVRYIQIYRGTSINIDNLMPEWTVQLTDQNWNVIKEIIADASSETIELLDLIINQGMPLRGHIVVWTCDLREQEEYGGWLIRPGKVKTITVSVLGIPSGLYTVKIVTKEGSVLVSRIRI